MKTIQTKKSIHLRVGILLMITVALAFTRLFSLSCATPLSNFTPIGAMALFGGSYFTQKWKAFLVPLLSLWISDMVISSLVYHHFEFFYDGFLWTYASFALMVLIGTRIKKVNIKNVLIGAVAGALLHWVITDLGVWLDGRLYPKNYEGFVACYVAALPYLKNMLMGNIIFSGIAFGIFEWMQYKYPKLQLSSVHA